MSRARALVVLFFVGCTALAPCRADARSLAIARFDADIQIGRDGQLAVTETLDVRFTGTWNGVVRRLPVRYRTTDGFAYGLRVAVLAATDLSGQRLRTEERRRDGNLELKVWVPGAADAVRTVRLRYVVLRALRFFADHDELYWNVTGTEWEAPIESATARVFLPDGAGLRARAFTGVRGSTRGDADVDVHDATVRVRAFHELPPGQGLTIVAGWAKGIVREPTPIERASAFVADNWPLAAPVLALVVCTLVWWRVGRDPATRPIVARWEPPKGMTPADCGALGDHVVHLRHVTATIVDLAVRGYLAIARVGDGWTFERRRAPEAWGDLLPHETRLMQALFGELEWRDVESLRGMFGHDADAEREMIGERLVSCGWYRTNPAAVRGAWATGGVGVIAAGVAAWWAGADLGAGPLPLAIGGIASGLVVCAFSFIMPARTLRGAEAYAGVLGLKEFLSRVDGDRLARLPKTPETFERLLPYAIALGVEKAWAKTFAGIYATPPEWCQGADAIDTIRLTDDLHRLHVSLGSLAPSSGGSGGSGWTIDVGGSGFGGGSVGGGFGGGGGGGF